MNHDTEIMLLNPESELENLLELEDKIFSQSNTRIYLTQLNEKIMRGEMLEAIY